MTLKSKVKINHIPVLVDEVIKALEINNIAPLNTQVHDKDSVENAKKIIDATVGAGGYSVEMVKLGHFILGISMICTALVSDAVIITTAASPHSRE